MTKVGLAKHAYSGAPSGCSGQWPEAMERKRALADWAFNGSVSRRLAADKRNAAAVMFALDALNRLSSR